MDAIEDIPRPEQEAVASLSFRAPAPATLKSRVADLERTLIMNALEKSGGHQRRAAASLGLLPTTLLEKMKRLGIRRTRYGHQVVILTAAAFAAASAADGESHV